MTNNKQRRGEWKFALTFLLFFSLFCINTITAQEAMAGAVLYTIPVDEDWVPKEMLLIPLRTL